MKKIFIVCIILSVALVVASCKGDDEEGSQMGPGADLKITDIKKAASILHEATNLYNSGNKTDAAAKAKVANQGLQTLMNEGREIEIVADCPIKFIQGDENMLQFAFACDGYSMKKPGGARNQFIEDTILFNATVAQLDSKNADLVTASSIADQVKGSPAGTKFTAKLKISDDTGLLMSAEDGILSSYNMAFNVKILEIKKIGK